MLKLIVAHDENRAIGANNQIPWFLPGELKRVKDITSHTSIPGSMNALIMGRKTWESLPENRRPLPGRLNIVLSRSSKDYEWREGAFFMTSLDAAIDYISDRSNDIQDGFIFGGEAIYREALIRPELKKLLITKVLHTYPETDTFFPEIPDFVEVNSELVTYGETKALHQVFHRKD